MVSGPVMSGRLAVGEMVKGPPAPRAKAMVSGPRTGVGVQDGLAERAGARIERVGDEERRAGGGLACGHREQDGRGGDEAVAHAGHD